MPEGEQLETMTDESEIYDNRKYIINITFSGTVNNVHIEQYGKPISPPPPPPPPTNP